MLSWLDRLPELKRQPNLLFATVKFLGGAQPDYESFRSFLFERAGEIERILRERATQTNEVARCSALLPALGQLTPPLALIEVGASAGLCLVPERYGYSYDGVRVGDAASPCQLFCRTIGPVPVPKEVPRIVWRAGIDLAPMNIKSEDAVRWLEACVWPDEPHRLARLRAAITIARRDPPRIVAGDLVDQVIPVASQAPTDATLVIFDSAVLPYLPAERRSRFAEIVTDLDAVWLSNEPPTVIDTLRLPEGTNTPDQACFVLGKNGNEVLGLSDPHGEWVAWTTT
jgi:hypothetical protein